MDLMASIRMRVRLLAALFGLSALLLSTGCVSSARESRDDDLTRPLPKAGQSGQRQISIQELDQLTYAYADRFFMVISSATTKIEQGNSDANQRRIAHRIELNGVLSMNDIVSGNDPYSQVFDLVSAVTLESRLLIDENRAEQVFGDRAPVLINAIRTMRVEAWNLPAKVLTQDQLERLDYIVLEWRRTHPGIEQVAYVKFDDFAKLRVGNSLLNEVRAGHGLLAPLKQASQELRAD